jgi:hypothetical protein
MQTINEIKAAGNAIIKNEDGYLLTRRGHTYTQWTEKEPGKYYPYNAYVRD